METTKRYTFEDFVSGNGLLNTTLSIGVIFLGHTYVKLLWSIGRTIVKNAKGEITVIEASIFDCCLNVIEAFFFGLVTFLVIRRANNILVKLLFVFGEFLAVFLYYNADWLGENSKWYQALYIAILSASSVFALGYISLQSYKSKIAESIETEKEVSKEIQDLTWKLQETNRKYAKLQNEIQERNLITESSMSQVSELESQVSYLESQVSSEKTSLLSEIEKHKTAKNEIEREFSKLKEVALEWGREQLRKKQSDLKKGNGQNPTTLAEINKIETELQRWENN